MKRHPFGPPGPGGPWLPGMRDRPDLVFFGGRGGPFGRRPKARRGDVRAAALLLLAEEPRNGYGIMQAIEERSEGMWRPSPGSVYPALQQLEDEGLVRSVDLDGRRAFELTDAGRAEVAERAPGPAPWEAFADTTGDRFIEHGALMRDVGMAFAQVLHVGTDDQITAADRVLADTRRSLYRILADGDPADAPGGA